MGLGMVVFVCDNGGRGMLYEGGGGYKYGKRRRVRKVLQVVLLCSGPVLLYFLASSSVQWASSSGQSPLINLMWGPIQLPPPPPIPVVAP